MTRVTFLISAPCAIKLLRQFTRTRRVSGLPIDHGHMKQYRDALRALERYQWRQDGLTR